MDNKTAANILYILKDFISYFPLKNMASIQQAFQKAFDALEAMDKNNSSI